MIQSADAGFTNLEVPINDGLGYPVDRVAGTWCSGDSRSLAALADMGFDLFACATNHSLDWSDAGLMNTVQALRDAGLTFAGIGQTLTEARSPAYRATPAGRIALVSMTTTFPDAWRAADPRDSVPGRPGINPLGHTDSYTLPEELWAATVRLNETFALDAHYRRLVRLGFALPDPPESLRLFGHRFERGPVAAVHSAVSSLDGDANLRSVAIAASNARFVVVSIHSHEMGPGGEEEPASFLPSFARRCIDAGASVVVCHGPHLLRGLEIYEGRLICYGVGNFFFQNELMSEQPLEHYQKYNLDDKATPDDLFDRRSSGGGFAADSRYWESVVVRCKLVDQGVSSVELHPITLGYQAPRATRGIPALADGRTSNSILNRLDRLTQPFGAKVQCDSSGIGLLRW